MPFSRKTAAFHASDAPKPNGNYSHCIKLGDTLHLCGWMGDEPSSGKIVEGGIEAQTVCARATFLLFPYLLDLAWPKVSSLKRPRFNNLLQNVEVVAKNASLSVMTMDGGVSGGVCELQGQFHRAR